jgi:hypothetical protein
VNDPFQKLLDSFELLLEVEKQQIVIEILHRTLNLEIPPLMEDELILSEETE